ncbi:MAG: type II secretion system minor pseudopilin GspK [Pseudomonadota bacterium]
MITILDRRPAEAGRKRRGVALLLTLLIVALLSASVLTFIELTHLEAKVADNTYAFTQAEILARAGLKGAMTILSMDETKFDSLNESWNRYARYADLASGMLEEGSFTGVIEDLSAKFNPNYMIDNKGLLVKERVAQFERLIRLLELDESIVPAVLDWLDPDDEQRFGSAENPYYLTLPNPYPCANGPLLTLGQLALVKGLTPLVRLGDKDKPGLNQYLTVYSKGQININTAEPLVLQSLDDELTPTVVKNIIERRQAEPFEKLDHLKEISGLTPEILARITGRLSINSSHFQIRIEGIFREARVRVTAVVVRDSDGIKLIFYRVG